MGDPAVRLAVPADADAIISLIRALADYEKLVGPDDEAAERLRTGLFADRNGLFTLIAEASGKPAGYAVAYERYSTFEGLPKLFLEDIFVLEQHRGTGAGFALFQAVTREAVRRGCFALEWEVLTWNRVALDFYERLGAVRDDEWYTYRLDRKALARLTRPV